MVQKFQESADRGDFPVLNESEKIIVLADEAHRTQYGARVPQLTQRYPMPLESHLRALRSSRPRDTNTFGSYIDTYTIEEAVKDGAAVQILYEGREAMLRVTGDSLDGLFDEYFSDRTDEEKAAIKRKFGNDRAVLEAPLRIRRVAMDILKHYREQIQPNGFKAMIVTSSRNAAILYKEALDKLEAPQSAVIISGDHNDEKRFWEFTDGTKQRNS